MENSELKNTNSVSFQKPPFCHLFLLSVCGINHVEGIGALCQWSFLEVHTHRIGHRE